MSVLETIEGRWTRVRFTPEENRHVTDYCFDHNMDIKELMLHYMRANGFQG